MEACRRSPTDSLICLPFSQEMVKCLTKNHRETFPILDAGCGTGLGAAVNGAAADEGISVRLARHVDEARNRGYEDLHVVVLNEPKVCHCVQRPCVCATSFA